MRLPTLWMPVIAIVTGWMIATQAFETTLLLLASALLFILLPTTPLVAMTLLLVLSPLRTLIATEASIQLPIDVGVILVAVFAVMWVGYRIAHNQRLLAIQPAPVMFPLILYLGVITLTVFSATSLGAWLNEWLKWAIILGLVVVILHLGNWQWLALSLIAAATANAIVGIYIFFGGSGALHLVVNERFFRAFGTFGQPNPFGAFMGLNAPLALMICFGILTKIYIQWRYDKHIRADNIISLILYALSALLINIALFFSWSRGAWLGFGVSIIVMLFALPRRLWQRLVVSGIVAVAGVSLWFSGLLPATITDRIESATRDIFVLSDVRAVDITPANYAVVERVAHWQAALNMTQSYPWLGVGIGNYDVVYDDYRLLNWPEPLGHAHNHYLNVLGEAGVVGLAGYLAMIVSIVLFTWRSLQHPDPYARSIAVGLLGTWTYLIVHSLTDNLYVNNLFLHVGVMMGILALIQREATTRVKVV